MSLFVVEHQHSAETCPAGDPQMAPMLLQILSPVDRCHSTKCNEIPDKIPLLQQYFHHKRSLSKTLAPSPSS